MVYSPKDSRPKKKDEHHENSSRDKTLKTFFNYLTKVNQENG